MRGRWARGAARWSGRQRRSARQRRTPSTGPAVQQSRGQSVPARRRRSVFAMWASAYGAGAATAVSRRAARRSRASVPTRARSPCASISAVSSVATPCARSITVPVPVAVAAPAIVVWAPQPATADDRGSPLMWDMCMLDTPAGSAHAGPDSAMSAWCRTSCAPPSAPASVHAPRGRAVTATAPHTSGTTSRTSAAGPGSMPPPTTWASDARASAAVARIPARAPRRAPRVTSGRADGMAVTLRRVTLVAAAG